MHGTEYLLKERVCYLLVKTELVRKVVYAFENVLA